MCAYHQTGIEFASLPCWFGTRCGVASQPVALHRGGRWGDDSCVLGLPVGLCLDSGARQAVCAVAMPWWPSLVRQGLVWGWDTTDRFGSLDCVPAWPEVACVNYEQRIPMQLQGSCASSGCLVPLSCDVVGLAEFLGPGCQVGLSWYTCCAAPHAQHAEVLCGLTTDHGGSLGDGWKHSGLGGVRSGAGAALHDGPRRSNWSWSAISHSLRSLWTAA